MLKRESFCLVAMRKRETPVPIPNTTVKTFPAEDSWATGPGKIGGCRASHFFIYKGLELSRLERTPDKREVGGSSPLKPTELKDSVHLGV